MKIIINRGIESLPEKSKEIISLLERVKTFMEDPQHNEHIKELVFCMCGTEIEIDLYENDAVYFVIYNNLIKVLEIQESNEYRNESIISIDKIECINFCTESQEE